MKRARPEQALHVQLVGWLRAVLPRGWIVHHSPNGGGRTPVEGAIFKGMGVLPGFPDLILIGPGKVLFMELKSPPKRLASGKASKAVAALSPAQRDVLAMLEACGWPVAVVRSLDDAQRFLEAQGVQTRGRAQ